MGRIETLCALIDNCASFADVGCDHGYIALHALKSGKCENVLITDISAKSLSKAEKLLSDYVKCGKCRSVCCDGLSLVPENTEEVIIAGMGGEEIIKIFAQGYVPRKFILQPMKNADKVRRYLIERGCKITVDDVFKDDKYYFVIKGERSGGTEEYSPLEIAFGKQSLKNPVLKDYAREELKKRLTYLNNCSGEGAKAKLNDEISILNEVIK